MAKKGVMGVLKKAMNGIKMMIVYIKCSIRIIGNFQKCIIFYVLDIIKYTILFFPLLCISICTGFNLKSLKSMFEKMDYMLRWDSSILNDCYLCKKKKKSKALTFWEKLMKEFEGNKNSVSHHLFFFFFVSLIVIMFVIFQIFSLYKNESGGSHLKFSV